MSIVIAGVAAGIALAFAALAFGFWGFLVVLVFGAAGGVIAAIATGRLDLRAAVEAGRSRRVG